MFYRGENDGDGGGERGKQGAGSEPEFRKLKFLSVAEKAARIEEVVRRRYEARRKEEEGKGVM